MRFTCNGLESKNLKVWHERLSIASIHEITGLCEALRFSDRLTSLAHNSSLLGYFCPAMPSIGVG
ncbi:2138_t:CDS:2 [Acaulospora colombiana]|uniref:2138_t:CDS:1 n=1 Tax=Acaulospora colombiana TaxID=27376 RepID=A0ACA9LTB9_9GLOM|nr:2138_t:CDS:2 [Acaulospora colombiana]